MVIMGLDLATLSSGCSILDKKGKLIYNDIIMPNAHLDIMDRMAYIQGEIKKNMLKYKIDIVALEDVVIANSRNMETSHNLLFLVGMILGLCNELGTKYILYYPSKWRKLAGVYDEKMTAEQRKREFQKQRGIELANQIFGLDLKWINDYQDKKIHDSDKAESALIALAVLKEMRENGGL
nr:MAG TPA: RuvC [Caudoviricetes sp.]